MATRKASDAANELLAQEMEANDNRTCFHCSRGGGSVSPAAARALPPGKGGGVAAARGGSGEDGGARAGAGAEGVEISGSGGEKQSEWVSLGFGIFLCIRCAAQHRSIGAHITLVRSCFMDSWSADGGENLARVRAGGNSRFREYLVEHNLSLGGSQSDSFLHDICHPRILFYRRILDARVNDEPEPEYVDEDGAEEAHAKVAEEAKHVMAHSGAPRWVRDSVAPTCQICNRLFNAVRRRHHCRKCGKCCCGRCAPRRNAKPIPEFGLQKPVRHCVQCYRKVR